MKKNTVLVMLILAGFFAYFISINLFAPLFSFRVSFGGQDAETVSNGGEIVLGFGDSVTANVVRNRWYGKIYEDGQESNLYLFNLAKFPLRSSGRNLFLLHFILISMVVFGVYLAMKIIRKRAIERGIYYY
jgi:hypothetical protein